MDAGPFSTPAMFSPSCLPPTAAASSPFHAAASPPFHVAPYGVEIANRVFVGGCPYNMTELELTQFFSKFGEVRDAKIITDRDGGKSRGYGFVTFATEEQAANVYSKGSIYYEQKKLNVAKAIRKHGGQYQRANQEYVNGQQPLVWLHPNGYLMTQQDSGWPMDQQYPSHPQTFKPCYSLPPPPLSPSTSGLYYNPAPYMQASPLDHTPMYGGSFYGSPYPSPYLDDHAISIISTSGHTSPEDSSHPTAPAGQETGAGQREGEYHFDMEALEAKTKQLSMDSAYTSEADLDSSQNTTAPNSGTASPKELCSDDVRNSAPSSPKQFHASREDRKFPDIDCASNIILSHPAGEGVATC